MISFGLGHVIRPTYCPNAPERLVQYMRLQYFLSVILTFSAVGEHHVAAHWSTTMMTAFFKSKGSHLVDAYLCSSKDAARLISESKETSNEDYPVFWRVVKDWPRGEIHEKRIGVFFDASCFRNQKLLENSGKSWFDVVYSWIIWDPSNSTLKTNFTENLSTFSDVVINFNGDFKQVTKFVSKEPPEAVDVGSWDEAQKDLKIQNPHIKPNLQRTIVMGSMYAVQDIYNSSNISAQMQDRQFKHGWDSGNRFFYTLGVNLANIYNFTLGINQADQWGIKSANGSWLGIVGQLQRGEADLAFTPMIPVSQRLEQSHASPCMQKYWFAVVFKQPRVLGTYKALIMELSGTVWALVGLCVLAGAIVFTLTMKFTQEPDASLDLGIVQNVGMFANQGLSVVPNTTSSRIVCITCMVVGLLVSNYYNVSTLTALLTEAPPAIKTLEDFINSNIKLSLINATYSTRKAEWVKLFRPKLIDKLNKGPVRYLNIDEGLDAIRKGDAFHGESFLLFEGIDKKFTDDEKCAITVFSSHVVYTAMRFVRKDKHLLEMVTRGLIKIQERGIVTKERDDWIPGPPKCFRSVPFIQVKLESVSVALGIYLTGFILACVVFFVEIARARKNQRKTRKSIGKRNNTGYGNSKPKC